MHNMDFPINVCQSHRSHCREINWLGTPTTQLRAAGASPQATLGWGFPQGNCRTFVPVQ